MLSIFVFPTQTLRRSLRDFRYSLPVRIAWVPSLGMGSGVGGLGGGIGPLAIDQWGAGIGVARGNHLREKDAVGADFHRLGDAAGERDQGIARARRTGRERGPVVGVEAV